MTSTLGAVRARHAWPWPLLLACIWSPVVYLLGAQWSLFPEYQYGWAVPFLCLYLASLRLSQLPPVSSPRAKWPAVTLLLAAGLVFGVMRVLQEADPLWRLASYGMVLAAVVMTLLAIYLIQGRKRAVHFIFPVAFFVVAVPWPTPVEDVIIQTLTRVNARVVVEVLNLFGVPAMAQGNVIEIAAGTVGIDEACSGIRSFQATVMIALFFGELYRLSPRRRGELLVVGPALAMGFNLLRTLILVFIAARAGLPAMERWHDTTGVALLLGCFFSLWGLAVWMGKAEKRKAKSGKSEMGSAPAEDIRSSVSDLRSSATALALGLLVWALLVEISTEAWFRGHENRDGNALGWSARWPEHNSTVHTNVVPPRALDLLRCDFSSSGSWAAADGTVWQAFYLRWQPADSFYGRAKVAMSKSHNPMICLSAAGMKLESQLEPVTLPVRPGFELAFDRYVFSDNGRALYVFFSQTEAMKGGGQANLRMTHHDRLRAALAGSRSYGQINFEVALSGPENAAAALQVFATQLPQLIGTTTGTAFHSNEH
jgi:exosortase